MTNNVLSMIDAHPQGAVGLDKAKLAECIQACFECAQTCTACADACLNEDMAAELADCIRTNLDCVDICVAAGKILSRHRGRDGQVARTVVEACQAACSACANDCARHASMHKHCEVCAEALRRCEQACTNLLAALR
jgi:hypothetical protein